MDTIKFNKKNVGMISHRGASGIEPENSLPAFIAACNRSYYGVETDVHVTIDGKFVVIHDETTPRLTGDNVDVHAVTFEALRQLRMYNVCQQETDAKITGEEKGKRDDLFIPSLAEYIGVCKKYGKKCVLDLNRYVRIDDLGKMISEIEEIGYLDGVIFLSSKYAHMEELRRLLPEQTLQYLRVRLEDDLIEKLNRFNLDLDIEYKVLTKELLDEVHANGHKVNVWTCDSVEEAEKLADWGVDYITSNLLE